MKYDSERKLIVTTNTLPDFPNKYFGLIFYERLQQYAAEGRIFQLDLKTGKTDTCKDFLSRCIRLATFMRDSGLKHGDIISTCTDNHFNTYVPILAAHFIGAIPASTDPLQSHEETRHLINLVKPKMFFVGKGSEKHIQSCIDEVKLDTKVVTFEKLENYQNFDEIMSKYQHMDESNFEPYNKFDLNAPGIIFFTSGTTGLPKAAILGQNYLMNMFRQIVNLPPLKILGVSGTYWISAIFILYLNCINGWISCILNEFNPKTYWNYLEEHEVGFVFLAYTRVAEALCHLKKPIESLMEFHVMGGQMPIEFTEELKNKLPNCTVKNIYGSTETSIICNNPVADKPKSTGRPIPNGQMIKIVDPETEEILGFNKVGEIRVKSNFLFSGYYNHTENDFNDADGFYKTGDLGYFDEDFYLFLVGRNKDIFKYKNWHISPVVIEDALYKHKDVLVACVFGKPHNIDGNHIMAAVVLKDGANVSENELLEFANARLEDLEKIRGGLKIVSKEMVPYTVTNKIKRYALRDLILAKL